jgi:hypothetical protein
MSTEDVEMTLALPGTMIAAMMTTVDEIMETCTAAQDQLTQAKARMAFLSEAAGVGGISRTSFFKWIQLHHPGEQDNAERWFKACSAMHFDVDYLTETKDENQDMLAAAQERFASIDPVASLVLQKMLETLDYV